MGFYNIYTEGQQAEEYKSRKTKEAEEKEKADREAYEKRYGQDSYTKGIRGNLNDGEVTPTKEDKKRLKYASKFAFRNTDMNPSDKEESKRDLEYAKDVANRNMRRHPDKWDKSHHESGIFESVEFLND